MILFLLNMAFADTHFSQEEIDNMYSCKHCKVQTVSQTSGPFIIQGKSLNMRFDCQKTKFYDRLCFQIVDDHVEWSVGNNDEWISTPIKKFKYKFPEIKFNRR